MMLRLVDAPSPAKNDLRHVAVWALEADMVTYLERQLRRRWPQLRVQGISDAAQLEATTADLCICGLQPPPHMRALTLWLGDVDRGAGLIELSEGLWKCRMPITGRHLVNFITAIWARAGI
jgi:hypothetical protein